MHLKDWVHTLFIFVSSAQNLHMVGVLSSFFFWNEFINRCECNPRKSLARKDFKMTGKTGQRLATGLERAPDWGLGVGYNVHLAIIHQQQWVFQLNWGFQEVQAGALKPLPPKQLCFWLLSIHICVSHVHVRFYSNGWSMSPLPPPERISEWLE